MSSLRSWRSKALRQKERTGADGGFWFSRRFVCVLFFCWVPFVVCFVGGCWVHVAFFKL